MTVAAPGCFQIRGARRWKDARRFRAGPHATAEERRVIGLHLDALEAQCEVVAFSRDVDNYPERTGEVARGLAAAQDAYPGVSAIGGVAVRTLECWVLAASGHLPSDATSLRSWVARARHLLAPSQATA